MVGFRRHTKDEISVALDFKRRDSLILRGASSSLIGAHSGSPVAFVLYVVGSGWIETTVTLNLAMESSSSFLFESVFN